MYPGFESLSARHTTTNVPEIACLPPGIFAFKMKKEAIRQQVFQKIKRLNSDVKIANERKIFQQVIDHPWVKNARVIGLYFPVEFEVNTKALIYKLMQTGKEVCLPRVDRNLGMSMRLINSIHFPFEKYRQTRQPKSDSTIVLAKDIDVIILPGLAFDRFLTRLGFGGGHYDRYLSQNQDLKKIMLAFEAQRFDALPCENHDVKVDVVITEKQSYLSPV
ncbi:5-formyltetrahydrofolate cyclo-ligase [Mycoplasma sp. ATU-Cv-703]|uniref:5-formyltetrahydrofolate cyclo-ligase n=1 Tax=Mycoplasma sp. ATU-Cv-703 TaxID=2498595 RepID=UPI000FDD0715